jgi:parallel beta-helix repeat protein
LALYSHELNVFFFWKILGDLHDCIRNKPSMRLVPVISSLLGSLVSVMLSCATCNAACLGYGTVRVSAADFGVIGDGAHDDGPALQSALDTAAKNCKIVFLPKGRYLHAAIITIKNVELVGDGTGTTLISTRPGSAAIVVTGDWGVLSHMRVETGTTSPRSQATLSSAVAVHAARKFEIRDLHVEGAANGGIIVDDSGNGRISENAISMTNADGIHITDKSHDILVSHNVLKNTGDDGIAVVSYERDGAVSNRISITDNTVSNGRARGIAIMGGADISVLRNEIACRADLQMQGGVAAIIVGGDASYKTFGSNNVEIRSNVIEGGGGSLTRHGAIMLVSGMEGSRSIRVAQNRIDNAVGAGIRVVGPSMEDVELIANIIKRPQGAPIVVAAHARRIAIIGNTFLQAPVAPFIDGTIDRAELRLGGNSVEN